MLLGWEERSCSPLHHLNISALCFNQIEEGGRLRNCLRNTKGCSSVRWSRHQIVRPLQFSHCLLLSLPHNPQVGAILLPQSQNLTHPGDEAILPRRHLARVWGKVLVVAVVLEMRLARVES